MLCYDTDNTLPVEASNLKEGYKVVKSGEDMSVCHKKQRVLSRRVEKEKGWFRDASHSHSMTSTIHCLWMRVTQKKGIRL